MPHPADWHDKAWAVLFRRSKSTARGAERKSHLCWGDPSKHWGPALFITKKDAQAHIARHFAWINDPAQNRAGDKMPKPVRVHASIRVAQGGEDISQADPPAWRPIATAPRTDNGWLALLTVTGPYIGMWHRGAWRTRDRDQIIHPTHWIPLRPFAEDTPR